MKNKNGVVILLIIIVVRIGPNTNVVGVQDGGVRV